MKLIEAISTLLKNYRRDCARLAEIAKAHGLSLADIRGKLAFKGDTMILSGKTSGVAFTPETKKEVQTLNRATSLGDAMSDNGIPLGALDAALRSEELAAELAAQKKAAKKASKSKVEAPARDTGAAVLA